MRFKELILDFTALLDVIMIILFWFILKSHNQTVEMRQQAEEAIANANILAEEYRVGIEDCQKKENMLDDKLMIVENADERLAENIEGIISFSTGSNLKIRLVMIQKDQWKVNLYKENEQIGTIADTDFNSENIAVVLTQAGFEQSDTILVDFMYDSTLGGTRNVHNIINDAFMNVRNSFEYLYISETDESMFEEG